MRGSKWWDGRGVAALFAATVVLPAVALAVLAYRALDSDRQLAERAWRERLEAASRQAFQHLERRVAETRASAQSLSSGASEGSFKVLLAPVVEVRPSSAFGWVPDGRGPAAAGLPRELADAELQEARTSDPKQVAALYSNLLSAAPAQWKGWVCLRRSRALARAGDVTGSNTSLRQAAGFPDPPGGFSTRFAARFELASGSPAEAAKLYSDLSGGEWLLEKSPYAYYEAELRRWAGDLIAKEVAVREARRQAMSRILERVLAGASGWLVEDDVSVLAVRAAEGRPAAVLVTEAKWKEWVAEAEDGIPPDLRIRAGTPSSIWAEPKDPRAMERASSGRRRLLLAMLILVAGILAFGSFATLRLVRRELRIAQLQSDFAAAVSHEFRSPLTGIRQLAEMLLAGRAAHDEARRRQYYELICRESDRLTRLVDNVLDFSRIEKGGGEFRFTRIETAQWLNGLAEIAGRRRALETALPDALPAVEGDREALSSAVLNLLDNAIKYSSENTPVGFRASGENGWVTIEVSDRGCGIAPAEQGRIFNRFYRAPGASAGEVKGVGLGLALVKRIADAHGARLRVESTPGQGSAFFLSLRALT